MITKQAKFILAVAAAFSIFSLSIISCKKKSTTPAMGTFYFHIHTNIDTNEVDDNILYADASGRRFGLTTAQFYLSNISLHNVNGSTYTFPQAIVLKTLDSEQNLIAQAPIGTYDYVTFSVGLDAATNALAPTAFTTTGYIPNADMWYGSSARGYMFLKVKGFADTTAAQTGTNLVSFFYEIGSAANLKTVTMPTRGTGAYSTLQPYILTAGNAQYIHLVCDYGKLLSRVNFKTQDTTDSYTINPALATTIANNVPNMFIYEE